MSACAWAACTAPAVEVVEGWAMCAPHKAEHYALDREDQRTWVRDNGPMAWRPHGSHAAYRRHQRHGEKPCDACRVAESERSAARRKDRDPESRRAQIERGLAHDGRRRVAQAVKRLSAAGVSDRVIASRLSLSNTTVAVMRQADLSKWEESAA